MPISLFVSAPVLISPKRATLNDVLLLCAVAIIPIALTLGMLALFGTDPLAWMANTAAG